MVKPTPPAGWRETIVHARLLERPAIVMVSAGTLIELDDYVTRLEAMVDANAAVKSPVYKDDGSR